MKTEIRTRNEEQQHALYPTENHGYVQRHIHHQELQDRSQRRGRQQPHDERCCVPGRRVAKTRCSNRSSLSRFHGRDWATLLMVGSLTVEVRSVELWAKYVVTIANVRIGFASLDQGLHNLGARIETSPRFPVEIPASPTASDGYGSRAGNRSDRPAFSVSAA